MHDKKAVICMTIGGGETYTSLVVTLHWLRENENNETRENETRKNVIVCV